MDFLEYTDVSQEVRGALNQGRLKLTSQSIVFKNTKTGKVDQIASSDVDTVHWQRLAGGHGLRVFLKTGLLHRFAGFKDPDQEKLSKFFSTNYDLQLGDKEMSLKGWNWGTAKFNGGVLTFDVDNVTAFEVPLSNVSHCTTAKNEVTVEFHQNDDAPVSLMELRFHIPADANDSDPVSSFHENVMNQANVIQATGDAIATFQELQCLTPRGRYEIKVFPSFIQLHGKTFDYKIPMSTVLRLFLLPHKDSRQMFFVISLDPPIKQGQTRYHFLILQFTNEEEVSLTLGLSEKELEEKYEGKLKKEMSGPTYEVISRVMKALVNRKITVPGNFVGASNTPAISCSYKAAAGFLYPLERGFMYVHKPPVHVRFDEVASVNFARSGGSNRSFDFEVELKSGMIHTFSSIEKEEYGKLFDFVTAKKLRIKNRGKGDQPSYKEELVDSDDEDLPDAYLARVKAEGKEAVGDEDSDDESDTSFKPEGGSGSEVAEEFDSNVESSESDDDEDGQKKRKIKESDRPKKKTKSSSERRPKKAKKDKDENKPKRPQSAYFLWLNESRPRIQRENPGAGVTDIAKKAGQEWGLVKDKTKWEKLAKEAKKEYEKAMEEYNRTGGGGGELSKSAKAKPKTKPTSNKSPTKAAPPGVKSKEYVSSSEGSDNESDKKKPSKKKDDSDEEDKASSANEESGSGKGDESGSANEASGTEKASGSGGDDSD